MLPTPYTERQVLNYQRPTFHYFHYKQWVRKVKSEYLSGREVFLLGKAKGTAARHWFNTIETMSTLKPLADVKANGKSRRWRERKKASLKYADCLHRLKNDVLAERVHACGDFLEFAVYDDDTKKLHNAGFCRDRLCPLCAWRRSYKIAGQVSQVMKEEDVQGLVPLLLTLTIKNCTSEELPQKVNEILTGYRKIFNRTKMKRIFKGWFRALEVTYNSDVDTFHPHIHAILLVDKSYFDKANTDYLTHENFVVLWREATGLDYDPTVDIRKVRGTAQKAVSEVAKYTVKAEDYIIDDDEAKTDYIVATLRKSLKGRRLVSFGGVMKEVAARLKLDDVQDGDLIHIDEEKAASAVIVAYDTYTWHRGFNQYYFSQRREVPPDMIDSTKGVVYNKITPQIHKSTKRGCI